MSVQWCEVHVTLPKVTKMYVAIIIAGHCRHGFNIGVMFYVCLIRVLNLDFCPFFNGFAPMRCIQKIIDIVIVDFQVRNMAFVALAGRYYISIYHMYRISSYAHIHSITI
jgi:hypothetical protein